MGWFEDQLSERLASDNSQVQDANLKLSSIVMGKKILQSAMGVDGDAETEILRFYSVSSMSQLSRRDVTLTAGWYNESIGAILAKTKWGLSVALIPKRRGYYYFDSASGKQVNVTDKTLLEEEAVCFYRQLPDRAITLKDLFVFVFKCLSRSDVFFFLLFMLFGTLLGMFLPRITQIVFSKVIPSGQYSMLAGTAALLACIMVSLSLINICASLSSTRIMTKIDTAVLPAIYLRVLSLPVSFFKNFSSGELAERLSSVKSLYTLFFGIILPTIITFLFSIIYLFQINSIASEMSSAVVIVLALILLLSLTNTFVAVKISNKQLVASAKLSGLLFHLLSGIQKIKLTGCAKRAEAYGEKASYMFNPPMLMKIGGSLNTAVSMLGGIIFFALGAKNHISSANYMAFIVAYGLIWGGVLSLGQIVSAFAKIKPNYNLAKPILDSVPENYVEKEILRNGIASIEFSHVNFRYNNDTPFIFNNLCLNIRKGEYIGIAGKTGCGKSTLVRLLLGFEQPVDGSVFINGINMGEIDCKAMRRKMGVVMQTSRLFIGDIFSNISVTNPDMNMDDAWNVARLVGMEEEIKNMPMGMRTLLTEGGSTLSGGQRQRLIIARAIAANPDILIFDEATSALDNITQKQVSDSLDSLKCTRIVIAHRLSTIKNCSRIIVIDNGSIIEDGTFQELLDKQGYFAELVKRQLT